MEISRRCDICGDSDIVQNIKISQSTETGNVGLEYRGALIFTANEKLLADLCLQCGTIVRLHVKNTDRKWLTN